MKNKLSFILISIFVLVSLSALKSSAQGFTAGDNVIGVGIGLGSTNSVPYSSSTPALSAQYEHGNWIVGGPGVISLGAFLAYKSYSYDGIYPNAIYSQKWTYMILGFRGYYHYTGLKNSKFDPYGGLMLSYNIVSFSYSSNNPFYDYQFGHNTSASGFDFSLFLGGRYYFSDAWAVYGELGFGNSILTIGAAYKF